jgi:uncharacterized phiE125 gp8 family phage protein
MSAHPQRLVLAQTLAPTIWPVTVDEMKEHSRIDVGDDDDLLLARIKAATIHCEKIARRQFMQATWRLSLDRFPVGVHNDPTSPAIEGHDIILPRPKLLAVSSIKYDDADGTEQTLDASAYRANADERPARISLAYNEAWPTTRTHSNAVRILYTAGYSAEADETAAQAAVPEDVKQAIRLLVAHWYENREPQITGTIATTLAFTVENLLALESCAEVW